MTDWWMKLVVGGEGNVIRERSLTNWNTFDATKVLAEKERERASSARKSAESPADSNEDGNTSRE